MASRSRNYLKGQFEDGDSPNGADFSDVIDSFINQIDDGVQLDGNGNLTVPNGITLGEPANGSAGTLRFNSTSGGIEISDGTNWNPVASGGGGAFSPVGDQGDVAFGDGRVGIGTFETAPTYRFEVNLGANTGTAERIRLGNAVISNGQGASATYAQFSNQSQSAGNDNFALRQGQAGDVNLNAAANQPLSISHGRTQARIFIMGDGRVIVGNNGPVDAATELFQVNGAAGKLSGGNVWSIISDERLKQDIKPFEDGLRELMNVRPVRFHYNDLSKADSNEEEVGIIAQEIEKIFPYMVTKRNVSGEVKDLPKNLLSFNGNALTYVMVNSIKELANKVEALEKEVSKLKKASKIKD
jgi:hypothetical protein